MEKRILIVGANSFIAKATVGPLQANGYSCIASTRMDLDMENELSIIAFAKKHEGLKLDGIIFCQGINPEKNSKETSADHITKMLNVNITGPVLLMKHLHSSLNNNALVLFFSSIAATKGSYDPAYAASKAAINGLIQSFANEFNNCRFNAIALGLVENSPVFNKMTPDFREKHAKNMVDGKFIQAENVASSVIQFFKNVNINRTIISLTGEHII